MWHGYLLAGTGSNIYVRQLAREWSREGHDVTVFSQEPHPERLDLGGAQTVRPDVDGLLPVFVRDRYDGYRVELVQDLKRSELDAWVDANAAAIRERLPADLVFASHVLLGGPVAAATGARYSVKVHGSELEYSMRGNAELSAWGAQALGGAAAVIVGSEHIRQALTEVCGPVERVHEVPPGVDIEAWRPQPREEALSALIEEAERDPPNPGNANERLPDEGNAARLSSFLAGERPTVVSFGKLIHNKGVHLLLDALRDVDARAVIVGFGDYRAELEQQAEGLPVLFTGALDHRHLVHLVASPTWWWCPRSSPRRSGWWRPRPRRRVAHRCRKTLRSGGDRPGARGGVPGESSPPRELPARGRSGAPGALERDPVAVAGGSRRAPRRRPERRSGPVELDERRRAAPRGIRRARGRAEPELNSRLLADVAQLVEHFTRNEGVPGSSPGVGFNLRAGSRRTARYSRAFG